MLFSFFYLRKFWATLSLILGFALLASMFSYDALDPSYNVATDYLPNNWLGAFGAYCADALIQTLGLGSYLLPFFLIRYGHLTLKSDKSMPRFIVRIASILISCILCSATFIYLSELVQSNIRVQGAFAIILVKYIKYTGFFTYIFPVILVLFVALLFYAMRFNPINLIAMVIDRERRNNSDVSQFKQYNTHRKPLQNISKVKDIYDENSEDENITTNEMQSFKLPPVSKLTKTQTQSAKVESMEQLRQNAQELLKVLKDFGVNGTITNIHQGPVVTLYEFEPSAGTKSSRVIGLADDIARSLCALSTRISAIPGRNALGIEIPNKERMFFNIRELLETEEYKDPNIILPIILGKDLGGNPYVVDLAKMPHLLVAGTTGSGKSVAINTMIFSLLYRYTPSECKFIMIDPKMLELSVYDDIPHLLTPVVTEPSKAIIALKWAVKEMENRYRLMSSLGVRNIAGFNAKIEESLKTGVVPSRTVQTGFNQETGDPVYQTIPIATEKLPFIVIVVDEMADLMLVAGKDIEASVQRLAQMARAAGIHIIMATQRPSVDVITGVIKANFPSRVSFKVTSKIDSRTILSQMGAEQLLGMGDMLCMNASHITRIHGPFVNDREVEEVTAFLKSQGRPSYVNEVTENSDDDYTLGDLSEGGDDESLYRQAIQIIKRDRKVSTSYIQRCLRIGYNKAANIVEKMERDGIVSPANHAGKREILIPE